MADESWFKRINQKLIVHDLAILIIGSTVFGVMIGAAYAPYAQAMFVASGVGLIVGVGIGALTFSVHHLANAFKKVRTWKNK